MDAALVRTPQTLTRCTAAISDQSFNQSINLAFIAILYEGSFSVNSRS